MLTMKNVTAAIEAPEILIASVAVASTGNAQLLMTCELSEDRLIPTYKITASNGEGDATTTREFTYNNLHSAVNSFNRHIARLSA